MSRCQKTLAALSLFSEAMRRAGQQTDQSYKLETADYFEKLCERLQEAGGQEQAVILDEIARTGKVADLGLSPEELALYKKLYSAAEGDLDGLKRAH